ncbi:unnamed protein product [Prunus armeniaca]|uniref:Uncharacterized protein n=1 Tax=Prunus armeniaca TaxID=36596 RepID=A0A6J5UEV8_PRUAR|nr:unnamed protein product [Prunus armeniaca]CAB4305369.1 unnamed protein product [Prunus armeniaca]
MTRYYTYYTGNDANEDSADVFEEYDPTPYEGGYDMALTYGRPVAPSERTCYRHSSREDPEEDYDQPEFSSYQEPSAYDEEAVKEEYSSYARPSQEGDQYNIRRQGGDEGRRSDSYDDEEPTPAGEGGYGRKKYATSPGGTRSSWWPGCCTSEQAIQ